MATIKTSTPESFVQYVLLLVEKTGNGKILSASNTEGIAIRTIPGSITVFVDTNKYEIGKEENVLSTSPSHLKVAEFSCANFEDVYQLIWSLRQQDGGKGLETFPQFKEIEYEKFMHCC